MQTNSYPTGCKKILAVLQGARMRAARSGRPEDAWVLRDHIQETTGQRKVSTRISELRRFGAYTIAHNGRGGGLSAYILVDDDMPHSVFVRQT